MEGAIGADTVKAAEVVERLRARRREIEQTVLERVHAIAAVEVADPEYADGLREAVVEAIEFGLSAAEGEGDSLPVPEALIAQIRRAACAGVSLDTVLRRYMAGYTLLGDFIVGEGDADRSLAVGELSRISRAVAAGFDRIVVSVADEYKRETERRLRTTEHALVERVRRLLRGELLETPGLEYEIDGRWHVGVVASGPGSPETMRHVAARLDRALLLVRPDRRTAWAWVGGARRPDGESLAGLASLSGSEELALALGEPAQGLAGWRATHRQALAALAVAQRSTPRVARYGDVALVAAAVSDELLASALEELYLAPFAHERDGGAALRDTLRAYFSSRRQISSAAAVLGISRQTVKNRLAVAEARIGRPIDACAAELDTALRFRELRSAAMSD